jgi:polygalacturonase
VHDARPNNYVTTLARARATAADAAQTLAVLPHRFALAVWVGHDTMRSLSLLLSVLLSGCVAPTRGALPPGPGPFGSVVMSQPVPGAARALSADGWKEGKLCDVSKPPYSAASGKNSTALLQRAIDDCGDLPGGGTVLVPPGLTLLTGSLFMRSNLTLRVEIGATLLGTATGDTKTPESINDAPIVYARRNCYMTDTHAGFINGAKCLRKKSPLVGWDDCEEWGKLENVVIEGGGTLDAQASDWYEVWGKKNPELQNLGRPMMLDLMWIDGLTVRDMIIRRPGYWTVHPTFSNNVRVTGNDILTTGSNTDGCDPDSSWNVYIANNSFSTGDDCE